MNNATLVYVPDALENVLGPYRHLFILNGLVLAKDALAQIIGAIPCIFHINAMVLLCFCVVESAYDIGMIHLDVN